MYFKASMFLPLLIRITFFCQKIKNLTEEIAKGQKQMLSNPRKKKLLPGAGGRGRSFAQFGQYQSSRFETA